MFLKKVSEEKVASGSLFYQYFFFFNMGVSGMLCMLFFSEDD